MKDQILDYSYSQHYKSGQDEFSYYDMHDMSDFQSNHKFKLKPLKKLESKKPDYIPLNDQEQKVNSMKRRHSNYDLQIDYISNKIDRQKYNKFQIRSDIQAVNGMKNEYDMKIWDSNKYHYNAENADMQLYRYYKNIDRVVEQNTVTNTPIKNSAYTAMLQNMQDLYPRKLGIIKPMGNLNKIELKNQQLGDKYMAAISMGSQCLPNLESICLSNNRISEKGAMNFIPNLKKNIKIIDLSNNNLGKAGCESIKQFIQQNEKFNILKIELKNYLYLIMLQEKKIRQFYQKVSLQIKVQKKQIYLKILQQCCHIISEIIEICTNLQEFYLHWNQIKGDGGNQIFKSLISNETLKIFDISWNSIGQGSPSCSLQISEFFKNNKTMCHLDLSNNNLSFEEAQEIQKVVHLNKTIYGLHFIGNYGFVDNNGFIQLDQKQKDISDQINVKRINGVKSVNINKQKGVQSDCCWICDGYQEANFEWIPGISGKCNQKPIYIHIQYENFESRYMGKMKPNLKFMYKRMVPYKDQGKYFFTADNEQTHAKDQPILQVSRIQKINFQIAENNYKVSLKTFNKIQNQDLNELCLDSQYQPNYSILPRTRHLRYKLKTQKSKKKWSIGISVFKDWKTDTDDLIKKCFEFDWNNNKIAKFIKNDSDRENIKNILRDNYRNLKNCYRYYSSFQPLGDIWALQNYSYSEFVKNCNIYEGDIQEADINLKWTSTVSGNAKGNMRMPERGMIRCQLMECIVRISEEKFLKNGIVTNMFEATERILNNHMIPEFIKYDEQNWRNQTFWTEQCDDCIKFYKVIIEKVYQINSIKKVKPGQKNFMCLEELNDICKSLQLYDEHFVERDMNLAYNLSMMTQIDEIHNDRIFQMSFVEFLEAISRIAEKKAFQPYATEGCDNLTYQQRFSSPLHVKMEALFVQLIKLCDPHTAQNFRLPVHSIFYVEQEKAGSESD